jgi:hypothetical protein
MLPATEEENLDTLGSGYTGVFERRPRPDQCRNCPQADHKPSKFPCSKTQVGDPGSEGHHFTALATRPSSMRFSWPRELAVPSGGCGRSLGRSGGRGQSRIVLWLCRMQCRAEGVEDLELA